MGSTSVDQAVNNIKAQQSDWLDAYTGVKTATQDNKPEPVEETKVKEAAEEVVSPIPSSEPVSDEQQPVSSDRTALNNISEALLETEEEVDTYEALSREEGPSAEEVEEAEIEEQQATSPKRRLHLPPGYYRDEDGDVFDPHGDLVREIDYDAHDIWYYK